MPEKPVPNRVIRYEIATYRDDRWVIECLREREDESVALAKMFLATDKYEAVRVVRERRAPGDIVFETPIFEQVKTKSTDKKPLSISSSDDEDCWCDTLDDLYGGVAGVRSGSCCGHFSTRWGSPWSSCSPNTGL